MTKEQNFQSDFMVLDQSQVYVKKDQRLKGIFRQMHKEFLKYAAKEKTGTKLYVKFEDINAIKVYEKLGMIKTGETIFEDDIVIHLTKEGKVSNRLEQLILVSIVQLELQLTQRKQRIQSRKERVYQVMTQHNNQTLSIVQIITKNSFLIYGKIN